MHHLLSKEQQIGNNVAKKMPGNMQHFLELWLKWMNALLLSCTDEDEVGGKRWEMGRALPSGNNERREDLQLAPTHLVQCPG